MIGPALALWMRFVQMGCTALPDVPPHFVNNRRCETNIIRFHHGAAVAVPLQFVYWTYTPEKNCEGPEPGYARSWTTEAGQLAECLQRLQILRTEELIRLQRTPPVRGGVHLPITVNHTRCVMLNPGNPPTYTELSVNLDKRGAYCGRTPASGEEK